MSKFIIESKPVGNWFHLVFYCRSSNDKLLHGNNDRYLLGSLVVHRTDWIDMHNDMLTAGWEIWERSD